MRHTRAVADIRAAAVTGTTGGAPRPAGTCPAQARSGRARASRSARARPSQGPLSPSSHRPETPHVPSRLRAVRQRRPHRRPDPRLPHAFRYQGGSAPLGRSRCRSIPHAARPAARAVPHPGPEPLPRAALDAAETPAEFSTVLNALLDAVAPFLGEVIDHLAATAKWRDQNRGAEPESPPWLLRQQHRLRTGHGQRSRSQDSSRALRPGPGPRRAPEADPHRARAAPAPAAQPAARLSRPTALTAEGSTTRHLNFPGFLPAHSHCKSPVPPPHKPSGRHR
ncbi:hypothetical protein RKD20_007762 [Streptomyces sp. SLBN-8D4]|jgi:hypothetical protein